MFFFFGGSRKIFGGTFFDVWQKKFGIFSFAFFSTFFVRLNFLCRSGIFSSVRIFCVCLYFFCLSGFFVSVRNFFVCPDFVCLSSVWQSGRWEDGTTVNGMNRKRYARVRQTLPQVLRLGLPPPGRVAALGTVPGSSRARKGKNITSVTGLNQKLMNQNMMNQKMTNSLYSKVQE